MQIKEKHFHFGNNCCSWKKEKEDKSNFVTNINVFLFFVFSFKSIDI